MKESGHIILVVDDIELNRAMLCELFRGRYTLVEAANGREALESVERYGTDIAVILLDVVMPVINGLQVLEAMRQRGWTGMLPVILITAESSDETFLRGYSLGVSDIINKPFNPDIVRRRVENIIELYDHKRRLEDMIQDQLTVLDRQAQKLKQTNNFVIDTLSTVVEFRNGESGYHIERIRTITRILLEALSNRYEEYHFSAETIETIASASAMHDIGKIAIPDSVLLKPGRLTPEEFEIMKTHTIRGCEILQSLNYAQDEEYYNYCYEICRHHHERWDGAGYPDHLHGDQISIWAQVVSLADVYEALISERVYKPPYSHEDAVSMILHGECGAFNPKLLLCFTEVADLLRQHVQSVEKTPGLSDRDVTAIPSHSQPKPIPDTETVDWRLALAHEQCRAIAELSGALLFSYDPSGQVLRFSDTCCALFGVPPVITLSEQQSNGLHWISPQDGQVLLKAFNSLTPTHSRCKTELCLQTRTDGLIWFELILSGFWRNDTRVELLSVLGKLSAIDAEQQAIRHLRQRCDLDPLTGLPNRGAAEQIIATLLRPGTLSSGALLLVNLDGFRAYNQLHGHLEGDVILQRAASLLKSSFRVSDVVGRVGGDEFLVFLSNIGSRADLEQRSDDAMELFRRSFSANGLSVSIGMSRYPLDGDTYSVLMEKARKAKRYAGNCGGNRYVIYSDRLELHVPVLS